MKGFNHKNRSLTSAGPHWIGLILMAAGAFVLASRVFIQDDNSLIKTFTVGLVAVIVGWVIVSYYSGTLIDFERNKMMAYRSVCGYKTGKWVDMPPVHTIRLTQSSVRSSFTPNGITPTPGFNSVVYKIFLYTGNTSAPLFCLEYTTKHQAAKEASLLSKQLQATLLT